MSSNCLHMIAPGTRSRRSDGPYGDSLLLSALPHAEVGAALRRVRESGVYHGTVLSFEFLVLTACRSGEVGSLLRGATWQWRHRKVPYGCPQ